MCICIIYNTHTHTHTCMYVCIYIYAILSPTAYYSSKINLKSCKFLMFFTRAQPGDQGGRQDFGFWRWPADGQGKNLGSPPKKSVIELNLTGKLLVKHCEIMTNVGWLESKKKKMGHLYGILGKSSPIKIGTGSGKSSMLPTSSESLPAIYK